MNHGFYRQDSVHQRIGVLFSLLILGGFFWLNTACAAEIYTWTDKDGLIHFSDLPPATGSSQQLQVEDAYRPGTSDAYQQEDNPEPGPNGETDDATTESPQSYAQQVREERAIKREKRKEAEAETAVLCKKYEELLAQLEPARRVFYTNEQGEQVRMDDDQRLGRIEESKDYLAKNCR